MAPIEYRQSVFGSVDVRLKDGHCVANCAIGHDYVTVLLIHTDEKHQNQGEAQKLLCELKCRAESAGKTFRVWAPLTHTMMHICQKLKIEICDLEGVLEDAEANRSATASASR